jgi:carbon storage regulator CsrA
MSMLIIERKPGHGLWIGEEVRVSIHSVRGQSVRLCIEAPRGVAIARDEIDASHAVAGHVALPGVLQVSPEPLNVLLIDDDPAYSVLVCHALQTCHARLACVVESGCAAVAIAQRMCAGEQPIPDLVLLDLALPDLDGIEVLRCLRAMPSFEAVPIVAHSCTLDHARIERALQAGANAFIAKPDEWHEIKRSIQSVVDFWTASLRRRRSDAVDDRPPHRSASRMEIGGNGATKVVA